MDKQDLKKLKESAISVEKVINSEIPDDADTIKVFKLFAMEQKLISDEEARAFNEEMTRERLQIDKDQKMFNQNLDNKKFEEEKKQHAAELDLRTKEFNLAKGKQDAMIVLETNKLQLETARLEFEQSQALIAQESQKSDKMFRWISLGVSSLLTVVGIIVPIVVYRKLAYANLKLIYRDEGRPTQDFRNSIRVIENMIKS